MFYFTVTLKDLFLIVLGLHATYYCLYVFCLQIINSRHYISNSNLKNLIYFKGGDEPHSSMENIVVRMMKFNLCSANKEQPVLYKLRDL